MDAWVKVALVLANVGAINWGLDALGFNVVDLLVGSWPTVAMVVYLLVGVCGLVGLYKVFK